MSLMLRRLPRRGSSASNFLVNPQLGFILEDQVEIYATTDQLCFVHYVAVADDDTAPIDTEIKNGQESGGGSPIDSGTKAVGLGEFHVIAKGLTKETAYDIYVITETLTGVLSSVTKVDVTTAESVWDREEVLEAFLPEVGITVNGNSQITAIAGVKGALSLSENYDEGSYSLLVKDLKGGKAFDSVGNRSRMELTGGFGQQYFGMMTYVETGSTTAAFLMSTTGFGGIEMKVVSNKLEIRGRALGDSYQTYLQGSDTLDLKNPTTLYWDFNAAGMAVGHDGKEDNSNSLVKNINTVNPIYFLTQSTGIGGPDGFIGPLIIFNRTLTAGEQEFWNKYLKSRYHSKFNEDFPFTGESEETLSSNILAAFGDNLFTESAWSEVSGTVQIRGLFDGSDYIIRSDTNFRRMAYPLKNSYDVQQQFFQSSDGASGVSTNATYTVAQTFTMYFLCNVIKGNGNNQYHELLHSENGADIIGVFYDKDNNLWKMQAESTLDDSPIELEHTKGEQWLIIKATFDGASSELDVDGATVVGDAGSVGLSGVLTFCKLYGGCFDRFILYEGIPSGADDTAIRSYLERRRRELPDYSTGINLVDSDLFTYHRAFGGAMKNGDIIDAVYKRGSIHASLDAVIVHRRATQGGLTWGAENVIYNPPSALVDANIMKSSTGRILVNFFEQVGTERKTYVISSDDDTATWSSKRGVVSSNPHHESRTLGEIIQLGNGDLIMVGKIGNYEKIGETTDSINIDTALSPLTVTVDTGLNLSAGMAVILQSRADNDNYVSSLVGSYNSGTGELVLSQVQGVDYGGTGTFTDWDVIVLNNYVVAYRSDDDGDTWADDSELADSSYEFGVDYYDEIFIKETSERTYLMLFRLRDGGQNEFIYRVTGSHASYDDPITWGTATLSHAEGFAAPAFALASDGKIYMNTRVNNGSKTMGLFVSDDLGVTWGENIVKLPLVSGMWSYGNPIIYDQDNKVGIFLTNETAAGEGAANVRSYPRYEIRTIE